MRRAVRVAVVRLCAHVCARNASALAKTPVTSSAPQTVQPCGTGRSPQASAIASRPPNAVSISTSVNAIGVVARRVALHQHDLERIDRGTGKHEEVAEQRAAVDAGEQRETERSRAATPSQAPRPTRSRNTASASNGVSTTYMPVMKPVEDTVVRSSPAVCSA